MPPVPRNLVRTRITPGAHGSSIASDAVPEQTCTVDGVNYDDALMPPDPFAGDPNAPASFLEPADDYPDWPVAA